jgi:uncharacterized membrane protein
MPISLCSETGRKSQAVNVGDTERMVSAVAGGVAVLFGLSRLSLSSLVAIAAGGALLARGLSGHCSLYEALEMSTACGDGPCPSRRHHQHDVSDASLSATGESPVIF